MFRDEKYKKSEYLQNLSAAHAIDEDALIWTWIEEICIDHRIKGDKMQWLECKELPFPVSITEKDISTGISEFTYNTRGGVNKTRGQRPQRKGLCISSAGSSGSSRTVLQRNLNLLHEASRTAIIWGASDSPIFKNLIDIDITKSNFNITEPVSGK
ncbi:UNVERIFIED_CONTAM: hypothetical protein PYX00_001994 [Menopon gallinae]|uniref:Uncharacterized protein n=1 Tax=Menopon gallinae TaxID=328185 RepID=A0AAW2IEM0_9NEOP